MKGFYWVFGCPHVRLATLQKWLHSESIGSCESFSHRRRHDPLALWKEVPVWWTECWGGNPVGCDLGAPVFHQHSGLCSLCYWNRHLSSPAESQSTSVSIKADRFGAFGKGKSSEHIENSQRCGKDKAGRMKAWFTFIT